MNPTRKFCRFFFEKKSNFWISHTKSKLSFSHLLVAHGSEHGLEPYRLISVAVYVLHGIDGRRDARAITSIRYDIDLEFGPEVRVLKLFDRQTQRAQHFGQAELVRVVGGQQEQNIDLCSGSGWFSQSYISLSHWPSRQIQHTYENHNVYIMW